MDRLGVIPPVKPARPAWRATWVAAVITVLTAAIALSTMVARWSTLLLLCAVAAVMAPIELIWPLHTRPRWRRDAPTDVVHFMVNGLLKNVTIAVALAVVGTRARDLVPHSFIHAVAGQALWLQGVEALVISELIGYWAHRLSHTWSWWWKLHKVHHSVGDLDWLAAARVHPLDQALQRWSFVIPLYIGGFASSTLGIALAVFTLQGFFVHANVRWRFGSLRYLVVTPEFHHWHHSRDPRARNTNYAGKFPVLDRVFGSYYMPEGGEWPTDYGVTEPVPTGWFHQVIWPFASAKR